MNARSSDNAWAIFPFHCGKQSCLAKEVSDPEMPCTNDVSYIWHQLYYKQQNQYYDCHSLHDRR